MSKFIDLTGQKFGRLTVVSRAGRNKHRKATWNCICECGNALSVVTSGDLKNGHTQSCGCFRVQRVIEVCSVDIKIRIKKYINIINGRWIWCGHRNGQGYGIIKHDGKMVLVHRLIYSMYVSLIPEGLCVCHKNDVPLDVTPSNLTCQTKAWNNRDCINKGRGNKAIGEKHGNAKLTKEQVLEMRENKILSRKELMTKYNIGKTSVANVLTRKIWKHI